MQPQAEPFIVPVCDDQIEILYQDEHLLLINKPTRLLSLSGKHPLNKDSVHCRLIQDFPTATLAHRLDFGTSGVMLVALNKAVNGCLTKQFQSRTINKTYMALLHGDVLANDGVIDFPIAKDEERFPLQKICYEAGKPAQTEFSVLLRTPLSLGQLPYTKVLFKPISGRTHQLRIHSQKMGHSILGCDLYASDEAFFMAQRLMLHATTLEFDHPISGERIIGHSACPF
jgi:tRNA pseudouridine32 synthase/23S rRNA pseudouridine746 synthase